jgi:hypothetical protein
MKMRSRSAVAIVALASMTALVGCEKGPIQKAGERVDRALGQEPLIGKGPAERAGRDVDQAVDDIKK